MHKLFIFSRYFHAVNDLRRASSFENTAPVLRNFTVDMAQESIDDMLYTDKMFPVYRIEVSFLFLSSVLNILIQLFMVSHSAVKGNRLRSKPFALTFLQ